MKWDPPVFRHPPPGENENRFWFQTPPQVTENRKSVFIHPPPLDFRQPPPLITANYQYCDTLHTWWQMNYRVCNKKLLVTVSVCKHLQALTFTVEFSDKKLTVTVNIYRHWQLQLTFSDKKSTVTKILHALTVTVNFFWQKVNCN